MTQTAERKKMSILSVIHVLAVAGLIVWWGSYYWKHGPVRGILARAWAPQAAHASANPVRAMTASFTRKSDAIMAAAHAAVGDAAASGLLVVMFAFTSGVYLRRLEIWLQARSSGQAVALGATSLSDDALAANADRRPVLK